MEGCGFAAIAGLPMTDVQPRCELPTGVEVLDGVDDGGLSGCRDGPLEARRSTSLPNLGAVEDMIVDERVGEGMRVSIRRISWTLTKNFS